MGTVRPARELVAVRKLEGLPELGGGAALTAPDGTVSALFEVYAEPDRPYVRPRAAFEALLGALRPGWGLRMLLLAAPDPELRRPFLAGLKGLPRPENRLAQALLTALLDHWSDRPPPPGRRALLELIAPSAKALAEAAWTVPELLAGAGIVSRGPLPVAEALRWIRAVLEPGARDLPAPDRADPAVAAPTALELTEDGALYPEGWGLFPLTLREEFVPGDPVRPLARLAAMGGGPEGLLGACPGLFGVVVRVEAPAAEARRFRARRALTEGLLWALYEKLGRSWSAADVHRTQALDQAESAVVLGTPALSLELLWAFVGPGAREARREAEDRLRALGAVPQTFHYIPGRALLRLQPGGGLAGMVAPIRALLPEAAGLLPVPERAPTVPQNPVAVGVHALRGRDVYYSFAQGFDPQLPPPAHGLVLILGEPGSGKTTLLRLFLIQRLLRGRAVVSLDPEGENNRLCLDLGGQVAPALPPEDPETCLCHPLIGEDPAELLLAARFLTAAVLRADGAEGTASLSALHGAVQAMLEREPGRRQFSVRELYENLLALSGRDRRAGVLAAALEPFAQGGLLSGYFDRPQALLRPELRAGQWLNIDLSGLREENRELVYAALVWLFYRAVVRETQGAPDLFLDEGWRLLRPGPFRPLLDELSRRARKRGMGLVMATHLPQDLAAGGSGAFELFAAAFMGRLGREAARAFLHGAGFEAARAEELAATVASLPRFVFLAVPGGAGGLGAAFPVRVEAPPAWLAAFAERSAFGGGPR